MSGMTTGESLARARTCFRLGEYPQALRLLQRLVQENPEGSVALTLMGSIYNRMGRPKEAVRHFRKAIELHGDSAEAYNNLGITYRGLKRYPEAVSCFQKAVAIGPARGDLLYNLGNTYKRMGDLPRALESFQKAQSLDPAFVPIYNNLGTLQEALGQPGEAVRTYRRGLQLDQKQPRLHYNLGIALEKMGDPAGAEKEYRQALRADPGWQDAWNNLGIVQQRLGKGKEAILSFEKILRFDPGNLRARNNLGVALREAGRTADAVQAWREVLRREPRYARSIANLAVLHEEEGGTTEALQQYERVIDGDPWNAEALRAMGNACRRLGMDRRAEEYYRRLTELDPGGREHHLDLALIARDQEDFARAEEEARPDDEKARLLLGQIYDQQGHRRHAAQLFRELLEANPGNLEAHRALARLHREAGEPEKALPLLEKVMALEGAEAGDLDGLRGTLELYEETVSDFPGERRLSWDRSLQALKDLALDTAHQAEAELDLPLPEEPPAPEEDAVPIIQIGSREPVLDVEEEEEEVRLEEGGEDWPEEEVEIRDERAPSLLNLLKDEELYPEPMRRTPGVQQAPAPAGGLSPHGESVLAASLHDTVRAQSEWVGRLRDVLEDLPRRLPPAAVVPIPCPPGPPPLRVPGEEDLPRFARDTAEEPEASLEPLEVASLQSLPPESPGPAPKAPSGLGPGGRAAAKPHPRSEVRAPPARVEPRAPVKPLAPAQPPEGRSVPTGLLDYLEKLTDYLPDAERDRYRHSEARLQLASLKARLLRQPGLKKAVEGRYPDTRGRTGPLNPGSVGGTLRYVHGLVSLLPDAEVGRALGERIERVLDKIRSGANDG